MEVALWEGGDVVAGEGVSSTSITTDREEARVTEAEGEDVKDVAEGLLNLYRKSVKKKKRGEGGRTQVSCMDR